MGEEVLVVARVVGGKLQVDRYRCRVAARTTYQAARPPARDLAAQASPDLVVWSRQEPEGREFAKWLCTGRPRSGAGEQSARRGRPIAVELPGDGELPLAALLASACAGAQDRRQEGAMPAGPADAPTQGGEAWGRATHREVGRRLRVLLEQRERRSRQSW